MVLFGAKALDQYPRNKGLWGWGDVVASLIVIAQVLPTRGAPIDIAVKYWICMPILGAIMRFSVLTWMARGHENGSALIRPKSHHCLALSVCQ